MIERLQNETIAELWTCHFYNCAELEKILKSYPLLAAFRFDTTENDRFEVEPLMILAVLTNGS